MKALLSCGLKVVLTLLLLSRMAPACGGPESEVAAGPKANLVIQAPGGQVRIGEQVSASLILPLGSKLPGGHLDRNSCTSFEFKVELQTGWHDPWAQWYESGIPQHATGRDGPRTCGVVAAGMLVNGRFVPRPPPQISFTLNDWVQFDRPGKYTVSVTYRTEYRDPTDAIDDPYDERKSMVLVKLVTEPTEVEVLPEAANAASRADDSLAELRKHYGDNDPRWGESDSFRLAEWAMYSQTKAAIPLLVHFYETGFTPSVEEGLIGSPHQELVVREMEKSLVDPRHSVSFFYMDVLAFNAARLRHPELFTKTIADQWSSPWEELARRKNEAYLNELAEYTDKLIASLPHKHDEAQSDGFQTALLVLSRWDVPGKESLRKKVSRAAAALWPRMKQLPNLSDEEWRVVATPELLPFLRKRRELSYDEMPALYRLAPQEGWPRMIAAAERGDWNGAWSWASFMPENGRTSAKLDDHLLRALEQGLEDDQEQQSLERLLVRVGGAALARPVQRLLDSERCMGQPALWAFLLKHAGTGAEDRLLHRYAEQSSNTSCNADAAFDEILGSFGEHYWSPRIESIVQSQMAKDDGPVIRSGVLRNRVAIDAATLLKERGSADAQNALWSRMEKWHASPHFRSEPAINGGDLEHTLIRALLDGRNWLPTQSTIERLKKLCVDQCEYLKWERSADQVQRLNFDGYKTPGMFQEGFVSEESKDLEASLQRFPSGTKFEVTLYPGNAPLTQAMVDRSYPELGRFMRQQKFEIVDTLAYDGYGRCRQSEYPEYSGESKRFLRPKAQQSNHSACVAVLAQCGN